MNSFLYDTTGAAEILIFRRFNECRVTQNGFILGTKNINVFNYNKPRREIDESRKIGNTGILRYVQVTLELRTQKHRRTDQTVSAVSH